MIVEPRLSESFDRLPILNHFRVERQGAAAKVVSYPLSSQIDPKSEFYVGLVRKALDDFEALDKSGSEQPYSFYVDYDLTGWYCEARLNETGDAWLVFVLITGAKIVASLERGGKA